MGDYVPSTEAQQKEMLSELGLSSLKELYKDIPSELILDELDIPHELSQLEIERELKALSKKSQDFSAIYRGAGAYEHYIPPMVRKVSAKESFLTAYTPYQTELSQGVLQNIFEYQSIICEFTGMDVSNASMYDGASALSEACGMCYSKKRKKTLIASSVNPLYKQVVKTYAHAYGADVEEVSCGEDGRLDLDDLQAKFSDENVACFALQQPNFYGVIEDAKAIGDILTEFKVHYIICANPLMLTTLKSPHECGADIACGEAQPLGLALNFGGPYLGYLACSQKLMRQMPGRIVGQTTDLDGKRSFVLTLQTREQHIRREKATSNICTNQALCALSACVYVASMGPKGMREACTQSMKYARYLKDKLIETGHFSEVYSSEFAYEFVLKTDLEAHKLESYLAKHNILSGLVLDDEHILWCATEMSTKDNIDELAQLIKSYEEGK